MGRQHQNSTKKMDEQSCIENRTKNYEFAEIHDHRKEVVQSCRETKELVYSRNQQSTEFLVEKTQRHMKCNIKMSQTMDRAT